MGKRTDILRLLLAGLAAGDSLGSTSEFATPLLKVRKIWERYQEDGWPFKQVGGGPFGWKPGDMTDDTQMAMCMVRAKFEGELTVEGIGARFVRWMDSGKPEEDKPKAPLDWWAR